jgi:hypothetical protein
MIKTRIQILAALLLSSTTSLGSQPVATVAPTPHGLGFEDTYTITAILKVLRPCDPAVMTDSYQDVKVLADDGTCFTLSITYFPLNDKVRTLRDQTYATRSGDLDRYLRPTITCNWDEGMRDELLTDLKQGGIDPSKLKPAELVSKVAAWAFSISTFASNSDAMPSDWFVAFAGHGPQVYPPTRLGFQQSRSNQHWTDQEVFEHQLLGRQMFEARSHGSCTSSSIYLATILRALGVPTRILYFIPPCDANDPKQIKTLAAAISRRVTRQTILDGVTVATGFANHMFNEVWLDGKWQRLNYSDLGQEIVDKNYLGLMTHIDTCADISETHLAETWGLRSERWPDVPAKLSSVNPYQLVAAADHWGRNATHDDPAPDELTEATVIGVLWPGTASFRELVSDDSHLPKTDLFLKIKEWLANQNYVQLREFIAQADPHFVLRSPGHPDIHLHYNGLNCSNYDKRGFAMRFDDPAKSKLVLGATYTLVPRNQRASHLWKVADGLKITGP